ncbi:MAG: NAD(P)-binding domain-containing protein, partial [Actinomycetia bacterium]|nr:NAD(P)-binding domain-containing protein [Actinomycetes bacterium]
MEGLQERLGRLAIIGGGQMGEAIVSGLVHGALFNAAEIQVIEPVAEQRQNLEERYGIECSADVSELDNPQSILMAVKPQIFREVAASLAALPSIAPERVISIAAGVPTTLICEYFPDIAVIRVMPNIALKVSAGMSVVANAAGTPLREAELVAELFGLMGEATVIDEAQINAATAISGSGPAYFALVVEHLAACGIAAGLSEELAWQLAR